MYFLPSRLRRLLAVASAAILSTSLHALSVVPPTFEQLVAAADTVVRGTVTATRAVPVETSDGPAVRTLVTFHVERTLKGEASTELTLSFLGGSAGGITMTVAGMPTFEVGSRQLVFVGKNGRALCPVIAAGHGRYFVRPDVTSGRDIVLRDDGTTLTSTDAIAQPLDSSRRRIAALAGPLTLEAFESQIAAKVNGGATVPAQP